MHMRRWLVQYHLWLSNFFVQLARNYTDTKDKLLSTQTEIKNLKRVLAREVGDSVDIEKVLFV